MTDEEKEKTEKEYKEWLVHDHKLLDNPTYCDIEQKCFRAFFAGTRYGLAEGRKEIEQLRKDCSIWESRAKGLLHKNEMVDVYTLQKENTELNRDKTELVNSVTELKSKVTELEAQLKNNPYVELLQKEKAEMAGNFAKQIKKMKNKLNCSKYHYCLCKDITCKDCEDWKMND